MAKENISLNFRLRKIDETINYFLEEIEKKKDWISRKQKNVCLVSNYIEPAADLGFNFSGCAK